MNNFTRYNFGIGIIRSQLRYRYLSWAVYGLSTCSYREKSVLFKFIFSTIGYKYAASDRFSGYEAGRMRLIK